jgi:hypothetical protein
MGLSCRKFHEERLARLSLADFYASLEHAADVLGQKSRDRRPQ